MHTRWHLALGLGAASVVWLSLTAYTPRGLAQEAGTSPSSRTSDEIDKLVDQLGDERYTLREEATRQLFVQGAPAVPRLQERLAREPDPEIRHRLRYILENIIPPRQAVLLIRAAPETGLQPGDVITHANSRRVRDASELRQYLISSPLGTLLRVHRAAGPREVGPVEVAQLVELSDYVAPHGESLAEAVRLYATGFAEQAYAIVRGLPQPIPESELSGPLRARLAYTAGDAASAVALMADHTEILRASGADWSSPSYFDLLGPGKAPFHLDWVLATQAGPGFYATNNDPDLRIQRILLPANRCADALELSVGYWWRRYRAALGSDDDANRVGGNQLAVAAWMLYALDLRSECCRLIEPRSAILRQSRLGSQKWVRVETDAWLPFFAGDPQLALDGICEHALDILQRPPRPNEQTVLTRNPQVAARVAFFLYQLPDDPRVEKGLLSVSHHTHPALTDYLDWMLYALCEKNLPAIRRDLQAILPHVSDQDVLPYARALALLEYVQVRPDLEILRTARERMARAPVGEEREVWLAIVNAFLDLCQHRPDEARKSLAPFRERPEASVLWQTVEFLCDTPPPAANHTALQQPVLAVPMGPTRGQWLILSRDRRLMHFDAGTSLLTALEKPTPTWFPNPITWPWIGREEGSGRVWVYCRRRVVEIRRDTPGAGLRLNLQTADIPAFDRYISPHFSELAQAVAAGTFEPGENSEFLRREIKANAEYCADPDLPEIGMIEPLPQNPQVVHVALRGGPHLLIEAATGRAWTSEWMQDRLKLPTPPEFFAQALWEPARDGSPVVMLMSNQGLIRFELGTEQLTRIPMPAVDPFPPLIPESTPYVRRDPRYYYCAQLPENGGYVFRLTLADNRVEQVDMINEALPVHYYDVRLRSELRAALNQRLTRADLPDLQTFITDAEETVARWAQQRAEEP